MSLELQVTKDQSHTLYVPELDETYHSRNGAVEEALYVYIGRGLHDWLLSHGKGRQSEVLNQDLTVNKTANHTQPTTDNSRGDISILEIGFGTGLNAWLTALESALLKIQCNYYSLETVPLPLEWVGQLNYAQNVSDSDKELYMNLHTAEWDKTNTVTPHFSLSKLNTALEDFTPTETFDVIYFDAFAPEKQPELWTKELFQKLYDCLNENGVIVTYSSKGEIKRMWREIGFEVERLPGPPMKRHMLRGRKMRSAE
jgi:tRNA U34 5-methylaminomethyl-2-thiouridine-forming methyltransferase MnmC